MKFVSVTTARTTVAKSASGAPASDIDGEGHQPVSVEQKGPSNAKSRLRRDANMEEEGYKPFYLTEMGTITVGASVGRPSEPDNFEQRQEDFLGKRTASKSISNISLSRGLRCA